MPRVRLTQPLTFNLTGYGRETIELPVGEQDVPEAVAAFVAVNPEVGEIIAEEPVVDQADNPLPEDFPGRDALFEAGYVDVAEIPLDSEELVALDGVGKKTAERIIEALSAGDDAENEDDEDGVDTEDVPEDVPEADESDDE